MSECEIKVLYVGKNRNRTYITKEVAKEIGKTLRGAPIVGYYKKDKEDFTTHGEKVIIDDEGIKFQCMTIPYGFVSPDADVWFQVFEDIDDNGDSVEREYLMTTGYLWTQQFPESNLPVKQGRPQSMEFEKESLQGQWKIDYESGINFFIINDAIIQKLCILGQDVQPCFEGASITAPDVSTNFTLDNKFKNTLYSMMQDLKKFIKGETQMENLENVVETEISPVEEVVKSYTTTTLETEVLEETVQDTTSAPVDYVKKEEEEKEKEEEKDTSNSKESDSDSDTSEKQQEDEEEKKKSSNTKYEILKEELETLKTQYTNLQNQCKELIKFKTEIDRKQKTELISEFYMLSSEDKQDVIENIDKYTLDEIKAKLAVICFEKKVNFSLDTSNKESNEDITVTYNLREDTNNIPNWVKEVKKNESII